MGIIAFLGLTSPGVIALSAASFWRRSRKIFAGLRRTASGGPTREKRPAISELCHRLSFALKMGGFQMDMNDGEVRFHCHAAYEKGELRPGVIQRLVRVSLLFVDQCFPAFGAVMFVGMSAEKAANLALHPNGVPSRA